LAAFFQKYPNPELAALADRTLAMLLKGNVSMSGKAAGWAAGIVYAVGSRGCGVPNVLNADLEKAFDVTMSTIYKRSWQIRRLLGLVE
jgi:hypothetical protein